MAEKIDNVAAEVTLAAKMRARERRPMAQMPPQPTFRVGRRRAHLAGADTIRRDDRAVAQSPNAPGTGRVAPLACHLNDPHPAAFGGDPPHKGRVSALHGRRTISCSSAAGFGGEPGGAAGL